MNQKTMEKSLKGRQLEIERLLDAPVELVWEVWTNPEHIKHWWGPNGFTNTISRMDVKAEGEWNLVMHGPDGTDYKNKSVFTHIEKYRRIEYNHVSGPRFHASITFERQGKKTLMTWRMTFKSVALKEQVVEKFGAAEGLKQNVTRLEAYLQKEFKHHPKHTAMTKQSPSPTDTKDRELKVSRLVNAPRELVFKVFTDPNHVVHWWGPRNFRNIVHEIDIRPGGVWRFDMEGWGQVFPNKIIYQEIIKPEKIVFIHGNDVADLENDPDTFQNEITFEAKGQKTLVTIKVIFKSAEVLRKNVEENHAIEGGNQTLDKLEEYLENVNVNTSQR